MKKKPLLFRLTKRVTLFLFLLLTAILIVYITGNFQGFLDSTQKIILLYAVLSAIALIFFSIFSILETIIYTIALRRIELIFYLVPFLLCILYAAIAAISASAILFIADDSWLHAAQ